MAWSRPARQKFSTRVVSDKGVREQEGVRETLTGGLIGPRWSSTNAYRPNASLLQAPLVFLSSILNRQTDSALSIPK